MNIKITKDIEILGILHVAGNILQVTNDFGKKLIEEEKAIAVSRIPAIVTKANKKKKND